MTWSARAIVLAPKTNARAAMNAFFMKETELPTGGYSSRFQPTALGTFERSGLSGEAFDA
jgi:hypothetical protein